MDHLKRDLEKHNIEYLEALFTDIEDIGETPYVSCVVQLLWNYCGQVHVLYALWCVYKMKPSAQGKWSKDFHMGYLSPTSTSTGL